MSNRAAGSARPVGETGTNDDEFDPDDLWDTAWWASQHPEHVTLNPALGLDHELLARTQQEMAAILEAVGDPAAEGAGYVAEPRPCRQNEVEVASPHIYLELLATTIQICRRISGGSSPGADIRSQVEQMASHEFAHAAPAAGQGGLTVRYGVRFVTDRETRKVLFMPYIRLEGRVFWSIHQAIAAANGAESSAVDRIMQGMSLDA